MNRLLNCSSVSISRISTYISQHILFLTCGFIFTALLAIYYSFPTGYRCSVELPDKSFLFLAINRFPKFTHRLTAGVMIDYVSPNSIDYKDRECSIFPSRFSISDLRIFWCNFKIDHNNKYCHLLLFKVHNNYQQAILIDKEGHEVYMTNIIVYEDQICTIDPFFVKQWDRIYGSRILRIKTQIPLGLHWNRVILNGLVEL